MVRLNYLALVALLFTCALASSDTLLHGRALKSSKGPKDAKSSKGPKDTKAPKAPKEPKSSKGPKSSKTTLTAAITHVLAKDDLAEQKDYDSIDNAPTKDRRGLTIKQPKDAKSSKGPKDTKAPKAAKSRKSSKGPKSSKTPKTRVRRVL